MDQYFLFKLNSGLVDIYNKKYLLTVLKSKNVVNIGVFFESSEDIFSFKNLPLLDKMIFLNGLGHKIFIYINSTTSCKFTENNKKS